MINRGPPSHPMSTHAKRSYTHQNNQAWTKNVRVLIMLKVDTMGRTEEEGCLPGRQTQALHDLPGSVHHFFMKPRHSILRLARWKHGHLQRWESLVRGSVVRLHVNWDTHQLMSWQILLLHEWAILHTGTHKCVHTHTYAYTQAHMCHVHAHTT